MENAIIQYNKVYFQQVHQIKVYQGKIYDKMELDKIRDKILQETLQREDYDDKEVYNFLLLLKQPEH